jgi:hypothetical protein
MFCSSFGNFIYHCVSIAALGLLLAAALPVQATQIRVVQGSNSIESYARGLLRLALSKLPEKYEIVETAPNVSEERVVSMLMDNQLDVVWYATTDDLENRMQPVRIPIYRGLLGYRLLMIKKGTQHKFDGIKTLNDLKRISFGQGRFWADTSVLTANNLNVLKVLKYEGLFFMLDGERFDAFPRGAHEPWSEMQRYPQLALEVEKNLLLAYVNPFYFFVNKSNTQLAADVERGLRIAIEDGSFDKYFFNDPTVQDVMTKANLQNRTIIKLDNPSLPQLTPINEKALWFDPYASGTPVDSATPE